MNLTSNLIRSTAFLLLLAGAVIFNACKEDDPIPVATVSFTNSSQVIGEQSGEQTINITFSRPAAATGTVTVNYSSDNATYGNDFTTTPTGSSGSFEITIAKGQSAAQFKITPVNNNLLDGDKSVEFTLSDPEKGFELGANAELTVSITDDESPVQANFAVGSSSIAEATTAGLDVVINLSAAAPGAGNLILNVSSDNAVYGTHYTTVPAATNNSIALPYTPGQLNANVKVIPVDDLEVNANRLITLTLSSSSSEAVVIGSIIPSHQFTLNDDETASQATFATASGTVSEGDAAGIQVNIGLSPAASAAGSVKVTLTSENAVYGTAYTTDPAATEGVVTIPVAAGETTVSFKVIPVNDSEEKSNRLINLAITGGTGIVTPGSSNTSYALTISEDDIASSITSVRALYQGATSTITDDIYIRGVITSTNDNLNSRNVFIQDAFGAIQLRFATTNTLERGDEVRVELKDVAIGLNAGLLQLGGSSGMPNTKATKIGTKNLPSYQTITISDLNSGNYESKLVKIENVGFFDANGVNNLRYDGGSGAGNNKIGDAAGNTAIVRVESTSTSANSPFANALIPTGTGTLQGIVGVFNGLWQLSPMVSGDVFTDNGTATISVNPVSLSFGDVTKGSSSTLTYDLSGTSLIGNISIKAPASYTVSSDGSTFAQEISVPSSTVNTGPVTITVNFSPNSGVNQTIAGKLVIKSIGATVKEVDVSGNETGNEGLSTIQLNEQFDYPTGQLTAVNTGANVSGGKWVNFSGSSLPLQVTAGSLSYTGYPGTTGNKVSMVNGSAEDAYTAFPSVTTGKVYLAFLVNVTSATGLAANTSTTGDHFAGLLPGNSTSNFAGRVSLRAGASANTYQLGLRATGVSSQVAEFSSTDLPLNTTVLIVLSYEIVSGTTNDIVKMFINPDISGAEPAASFTQTSLGDMPDVTRFYLRQGTNAVNADVDGIRVALKWEDLFNNN
ncbi:MAG: DUF5689 domain-containing protein [Cyclobacteriaceae bacterium]